MSSGVSGVRDNFLQVIPGSLALKTIVIGAVMFVASLAAAPALANAKLAEQKQCMQCHAVEKDSIGPSFRTIKAVYRKMKNPQARLIAVMREGSDANLGPHWGKARMPNGSERPAISDREAKQLARWILS
jgi:cytochrome c